MVSPLVAAWSPLTGEQATGPIASLVREPFLALACEQVLSRSPRGKLLEKDGAPVKVPARALGFVRLTWERRRTPNTPVESQRFAAEVWAEDPKRGGNTRLEALVLLLLIGEDLALGPAAAQVVDAHMLHDAHAIGHRPLHAGRR